VRDSVVCKGVTKIITYEDFRGNAALICWIYSLNNFGEDAKNLDG
jgi:hypothetical protein